MSKLLFAFVVLLTVLVPEVRAQTTQPAGATVTAATPAVVVVEKNVTPDKSRAEKAETIGEVFGRTRFGELFEGKKKVTINDVKDPAFWIDTVRDLILAILGFIPRLVVAFLFLVFFWTVYRAIRRLVLGSMHKAQVDESIRDMLGHLIKWSIMGFGLGRRVQPDRHPDRRAADRRRRDRSGRRFRGAGDAGQLHRRHRDLLGQALPRRRLAGDRRDLRPGQARHLPLHAPARSQRPDDRLPQHARAEQSREQPHDAPADARERPIGIAYKESIDGARDAMLSVCAGDDRIAPDPQPQVVVAECADSSVNLLLRFWIRDEALEKLIVFEYIERCKKALDQANIQIPFPHMQLLVEDTPAIHSLAGGGGMRKAG
jgi:hypothetical protein